MRGTVNIAAIIEGHPEQAAKIEEALRQCMGPSRAEAACQRYIVARDLEKQGRFVIDEGWASETGFQEHLQTHHFLVLADTLKTMGVAIQVSRLAPVGPA